MKWEGVTYFYNGPVLAFKGDKTANAAEVAQNTFDQQLMSIFTQQYGKQTHLINYLTGKMQPIVNANGQGYGYSPATLTSMRTNATDTIAQQFKNAQAGVNAAAVRTGGSALPSSVSTMIESSLAPAEAEAQSQAQNNITLANAQLENSNYWNAISVLNGQVPQFNPLGYSGNATSGGNTVANLSGAVTAANGPTIGQILGSVAGGALGATGQILSGGFAKGGAFAPTPTTS